MRGRGHITHFALALSRIDVLNDGDQDVVKAAIQLVQNNNVFTSAAVHSLKARDNDDDVRGWGAMSNFCKNQTLHLACTIHRFRMDRTICLSIRQIIN